MRILRKRLLLIYLPRILFPVKILRNSMKTRTMMIYLLESFVCSRGITLAYTFRRSESLVKLVRKSTLKPLNPFETHQIFQKRLYTTLDRSNQKKQNLRQKKAENPYDLHLHFSKMNLKLLHSIDPILHLLLGFPQIQVLVLKICLKTYSVINLNVKLNS